jgi:predicted ArsR family transcriptional regulator
VKYVSATHERPSAKAELPAALTETHEDRTRDRVIQAILANGPSTASALAGQLGLTPAAIRRHLDALLAAGLLSSRDVARRAERGRGRPAKEFMLTDSGRDGLGHAYDDIAVQALRFLAERAGAGAVEEFAKERVAEVERRYGDALATAGRQDRPQILAEVLTGQGYAATTTAGPSGTQLCQHHCPVAHVAEQFPELCEAETAAFARLLGTHVQRLATIAHGDGVCTTHIPRSTARAAAATTATARSAGTIRRYPLCPTP